MKTNKLISIALTFCCSLCAFSQTEEEKPQKQKRFSAEAHIGMNLSTYHYEVLHTDWENDVWERTYKPGLLVGIGANIGKGKSYSFNPEVNYSQMGIPFIDFPNSYHIKVYDDQDWKCDDRAIAKERLHYLEVSLYSKWIIGNRKVQPFIALAPTFSFALKGTRTYMTEYLRTEGDVGVITPLFEEDKNSPYSTARYNSFDYSMKLKMGAVIARRYEATVGFRHSFTSFMNEDHELHFSDCIDGDFLMNFFMTFGYRF